MAKFGFFSMNELMASPRLRPIIERLHPAAVMATVKGVYEDVVREMYSAASERRIPELADLTDKILARLQDVEKKRNPLLIDASGVLFSSPRFEPALAGSVLEEMAWRLHLSAARFNLPENESGFDTESWTHEMFPSVPETAEEFCAATGAEDVLFFGNPEQAEIALVQTFCCQKKLGIARRDLYEDSEGNRFADRLFLSADHISEVGASNGARLSDFTELCSGETGLIWLASGIHSDLVPTLSPEEVSQLHDSAAPFGFPIAGRFDFASLLDLSGSTAEPVPLLPHLLRLDYDLILTGGGQLMGGPNCGILAGRKTFLDLIRRNGFDRLFPAHRADLAGLAETIRLSKDPEKAEQEIPVIRILKAPLANLRNRAERLIPQLKAAAAAAEAELIDSEALLFPGTHRGKISSAAISIKPAKNSAQELESFLENSKPGLKGTVIHGKIFLDLKTVPPCWDPVIVHVFEGLYGG